MNTVRSCFAASILLLICTVVESLEFNRTTCCTTPGDFGAVCQYGNQTFHRIDIIDGSGVKSCPNPNGSGANALQLVRKCCPPDQTYDPKTLSCQAVKNGQDPINDFLWLLMKMLLLPDTVTVVGYNSSWYGQAVCQEDEVLIDDVIKSTANGPLLSEDHNCFDVTPELQLVARKCHPKAPYCGEGNGKYTCVPKCCSGNRMLGPKNRCNLISKKSLNLEIYEKTNDAYNLSNRTLLLPYFRMPKCNLHDIRLIHKFKLLVDRTLSLDDYGQNIPDDDYCLEYYSEDGGNSTIVKSFYCLLPVKLSEGDTKGSPKYWLMLFVLVPSIVCLSVTLIVYAMLSILRNVHGYYVMCYIACLLLMFVCLLISQWFTGFIMDASLCIFFSYTILFSSLAAFCWLNVICFDIFWILRCKKTIKKSSLITMRTVIYNIYCWGFSSTLTCTAYIFQHSNNPGLSKYAPNFGNNLRCWFSTDDKDNHSHFIFFILPSSIMLIANLILFALTAVYCSRIKSEINKFKITDSRMKKIQLHLEKFALSMKLFLVMGIPWSFEIMQKYIRQNKDDEDQFTTIFWDVLDEITGLQGVILFVIFVAKRKVITSLRKKIKGSLDHSVSSTMNTITGSSKSSAHHRNFNGF